MKPVYRINGEKVTEAEYEEWSKNRLKLMGFETAAEAVQDMAEEGAAPGGHGTHWADGSFVSEALGCHPSQCREYAQQLKDKGITGVEVLKNGSVKIADEGSRQRLLKAKNMGDYNTAGSGEMKGTSATEVQEREAKNVEAANSQKKDIRKRATRIAAQFDERQGKRA